MCFSNTVYVVVFLFTFIFSFLFTELLLVPYGLIYSARIVCVNIVSMSIMYHYNARN